MKSTLTVLVYLFLGATFLVLGLTYFKVQKIDALGQEINQLDTAIDADLEAVRDSILDIIPADRMDSLTSLRNRDPKEFDSPGWRDAYLDVKLETNHGQAFFLYAPEIFKDKTEAKKFAVFFSESLNNLQNNRLKINQVSTLKNSSSLRRQVPRRYNYVYLARPTNGDSIQFLLKYLPDNWGLVDEIPNSFTDSRFTGRDTAYTRLFLQRFGKIVVPEGRREQALMKNIMIDDERGLFY